MEGGMKFLVVDDSVEDVALLRSALTTQAQITPIEDGTQALALLTSVESWPFDLVVIDWRLPGIGGDQIAREFLRNPVIQQVPVVVLSSTLPPPVSHQLQQCGALILEKPIDLDGYDRLAEGLCALAKSSKAKTAIALTN